MSSTTSPVRAPVALSLLAVAAMLFAPAVAAADPLTDPVRPRENATARPAMVQKLYDCRVITDPAARLACFDAGVAELAQADARGDVKMATREEVRAARRGLFGLTLPRIGLFGGGDNAADAQEEIDEIETTVERVFRAQNGWGMIVDGGVRWVQTDGKMLVRDPKPGMKIKIRRGAIGSYLANVEGQRAIRVKREN